jgi:hypothetical protein
VKLVRIKVVFAGLLLALMVSGGIDAKPPRLKWQDFNCWMLSAVYVLWSITELTDWIVGQSFKTNAPMSVYARLAQAIRSNPGDNAHFTKELGELQRALEGDLGLAREEYSDPFDVFNHTLMNLSMQNPFKKEFFEKVDAISLPPDELERKKLTAKKLKREYIPGFMPLFGPDIAVGKSIQDLVEKSFFVDRRCFKYPLYLLWVGDQLNPVISVPLTIDTAPLIDPLLGAFEKCEYELVNVAVHHQGAKHYTTYIKDAEDGQWYLSDNFGSEPALTDDLVAKNKKGFWDAGNQPRLLLYKRTKLIPRKKDPLQEKLEQLSGSLETLAGQLKKK